MTDIFVSILGIILGVIIIYPIGKIVEKMGYSFWWCLPATIPLFTPVFLYIFVYRKWPVEKELIYLRKVYAVFSQMTTKDAVEEIERIKNYYRSAGKKNK